MFVLVLLNNLNGKFKEFTYRVITSLTPSKDLEFNDIIAKLHEEERLSKRDNTARAIAAYIKKYS